MTATTSYRDLVPARLRREWFSLGLYEGRTIYQRFAEHADIAPDRPAVIDDEGTVTYDHLHRATLSLAGALVREGVTAGDTVAINLPNGWRACAADLATAAIGAIALPYPMGRGRHEALSMLRRSRAVTLIAERTWGGVDCGEMLAGMRAELPVLRRVVFHETGVASELDALLSTPSASPPATCAPHPDAPARILVSSGSEAEPKMVLYSHNALADGRGRFIDALHRHERPMRNFFLVPLASSFGSTGTSVTLAQMGGTLIVQRRFDATSALRAIESHRPTHVLGVPTMFQMMLAVLRSEIVDTSSLVALVSGGAGVAPATVDACVDAFGCAFINLYGSADGVNCHTNLDDPLEVVRSTVGRPNPAVTTIRIVDESGQDCAPGDKGEIWSRGPMSPMCYVNAPELDSAYRTVDGWVRTGDLGSIGDDGRLRIRGRQKEIIIRGGSNISPAEVEQHLNAHPDLVHAVCVAVPDPVMGERLCACIVPAHPGSPPTLERLAEFLGQERGLERFKLPERLLVLQELPPSPAGKIDRLALKRMAARSAP
jgi:acyl-CoA synthetase